MFRKILIIMAVGVAAALLAGPVYAFEAAYGPTELIQHNPAKAFQGYTLFTPFAQPVLTWGKYKSFLIDMDGRVVHEVNNQYSAGLYCRLMETGNFLRGGVHPGARAADTYGLYQGGGGSGILQELDWNGNVLWERTHFSADFQQHHDFRKIWNKKLNDYTYIFIEWTRKDQQDALDLGANPAFTSTFQNGWSPCGIVEVNQNKEIIWRWGFPDHLVQNYSASVPAEFTDVTGRLNRGSLYADPAAHPERLDVNWETPYGPGPGNDWNHCNSLDYNPDLGHIAINAKHMSEFFVVDHDGTFVSATDWNANIAAARGDGGNFIYRFGNPSVYGQGAPPAYHTQGDHQMWASHDIQWIYPAAYTDGPALPGGGNFLIFDNGTWNPTTHRSAILEINPFISGKAGDGSFIVGDEYVNTPEAGYTNVGGGFFTPAWKLSNQVVWHYFSPQPNSFYSSYISGAQRLPNGNTLICSGATGHFFEVTRGNPAQQQTAATSEVVWEYINPVNPQGAQLYQTAGTSGTHSVFRCLRYSADYPGLKGKDLTPKGKISELYLGTLQNELNRWRNRK